MQRVQKTDSIVASLGEREKEYNGDKMSLDPYH